MPEYKNELQSTSRGMLNITEGTTFHFTWHAEYNRMNYIPLHVAC